MTSMPPLQPTRLRSGLTLYAEDEQALQQIITGLSERCPAAFVLLVESSGQLIATQGEHNKNNAIALGSLVAGDLAASQEIARLTGEYQSCQLILREGEKFNTFISEAGSHLVLFVQVSREVPLGWARLAIQEAARRAEEAMAAGAARAVESAQEYKMEMEDQDALSGLVEDALDALWTD